MRNIVITLNIAIGTIQMQSTAPSSKSLLDQLCFTGRSELQKILQSSDL